MAYNDMSIEITQRRVRVADPVAEINYDYAASLTGNVAPSFPALPAEIRRYVRKPTGQEFWIVETANGGLSQVAPDPNYSAAVAAFVADIETHRIAAETLSQPAYTTDLETAIAYAGVPFQFNLYSRLALPLDVAVILQQGGQSVIQLPVTMTESPTVVELIFSIPTGFDVTVNGTYLFPLEIRQL